MINKICNKMIKIYHFKINNKINKFFKEESRFQFIYKTKMLKICKKIKI